MSERINNYIFIGFLLIILQAFFSVILVISKQPKAYEAIFVMVSFFGLLVTLILLIETFCAIVSHAEKREERKHSEHLKYLADRNTALDKENTRLANEAQQGMSPM